MLAPNRMSATTIADIADTMASRPGVNKGNQPIDSFS
jgi:hypothetical protein